MRKTVEEHEGANQSTTHSRWQFGQGGDEDARHQYREGDAGFHARQGLAAPGQGGAEDHAADDEGGGGVFHEFALAHAPEADGGHGQQVVQAQHGVQQAAGEAAFGVAGVGHGGGGDGQQRGGTEQFRYEFHINSPNSCMRYLEIHYVARALGGLSSLLWASFRQHAALQNEADDGV